MIIKHRVDSILGALRSGIECPERDVIEISPSVVLSAVAELAELSGVMEGFEKGLAAGQPSNEFLDEFRDKHGPECASIDPSELDPIDPSELDPIGQGALGPADPDDETQLDPDGRVSLDRVEGETAYVETGNPWTGGGPNPGIWREGKGDQPTEFVSLPALAQASAGSWAVWAHNESATDVKRYALLSDILAATQ